MIDTNIYGYIKFTGEKWANNLADGIVSFSCAGKYIADEQSTGDTSKGDRLEAVFAHLKKGDERIAICKKRFGIDLEIIEDNEYVYLRRRSSCLVPIFCIFGITDSLIKSKELDEHNVRFNFDFPEDMYSGFIKSNYSCAFLQPQSFELEIDATMNDLAIRYYMKPVVYEIVDGEFYIEPTDNREELFFKRSIYSNQHEFRIILPDERLSSICKRKNITLNPCNKKDKYVLMNSRYGLSFIGKR